MFSYERLSAMFGVAFDDTLPLSCADFSVDLPVHLRHQIVFVAVVVNQVTIACFTCKNRDLISTVLVFVSVDEHGLAKRAERPNIRRPIAERVVPTPCDAEELIFGVL